MHATWQLCARTTGTPSYYIDDLHKLYQESQNVSLLHTKKLWRGEYYAIIFSWETVTAVRETVQCSLLNGKGCETGPVVVGQGPLATFANS